MYKFKCKYYPVIYPGNNFFTLANNDCNVSQKECITILVSRLANLKELINYFITYKCAEIQMLFQHSREQCNLKFLFTIIFLNQINKKKVISIRLAYIIIEITIKFNTGKVIDRFSLP